MTKMWLISPRGFNHIFVINGPLGCDVGMVRAAVVSDDSQRAVVQQSRSDELQRAAVVQQSCNSRAIVVQ